MLYLKGCPRCEGDIYADRDEYGEYRQCLQCGFVGYPPKPATLTRPCGKRGDLAAARTRRNSQPGYLASRSRFAAPTLVAADCNL